MILGEDHITIDKYRNTMKQCIGLYYPDMKSSDLDAAMDYSINKRYREEKASIDNSYKHKSMDMTLLQITDYIISRHPITTPFGTMFMNHETVPNPMANVVQQFLDNRGIHKKEMFKYPKGSEMYEHFNLLQSLDKIDTNGGKDAPIILVI